MLHRGSRVTQDSSTVPRPVSRCKIARRPQRRSHSTSSPGRPYSRPSVHVQTHISRSAPIVEARARGSPRSPSLRQRRFARRPTLRVTETSDARSATPVPDTHSQTRTRTASQESAAQFHPAFLAGAPDESKRACQAAHLSTRVRECALGTLHPSSRRRRRVGHQPPT